MFVLKSQEYVGAGYYDGKSRLHSSTGKFYYTTAPLKYAKTFTRKSNAEKMVDKIRNHTGQPFEIEEI